MQPYQPHLKPAARALRREATFPERLLWSRLRRQALGARVLRQHPIDVFVVDFCAPEARLVIEVDGRSHDTTAAADAARQARLEALGLTILRFSNDEILRDLDNVVAQIAAWLSENGPRA